MSYRFGITMRITNAEDYNESRDTIARDWSNYMLSTFPESSWLFIPNVGTKAVEYIKKWNINVLILSGGEHIGVHPERDTTELELLKYAIHENISVIAICRGLQLVHKFYGGKVLKGNEFFVKKHQSTTHPIKIAGNTFKVNSYHGNVLDENSVHKIFRILARCTTDSSIEGLESDNILAMMWHPERVDQISIWNKKLIEEFLSKYG